MFGCSASSLRLVGTAATRISHRAGVRRLEFEVVFFLPLLAFGGCFVRVGSVLNICSQCFLLQSIVCNGRCIFQSRLPAHLYSLVVLPVRSYLCHNHSVWLDIDLTASVVRFGSFVLRLCSILGVSDALNNFGREVGHGMFDRREMARLC